MSASFDALDYARKLEKAGIERNLAEIQAEALRSAFDLHNDANRRELATKADLRETELRLKYSLLKWQSGLAFALAAIMAKGFGWPGF